MQGISPNLNPDVVATDGVLVAIQQKIVEYLRAIQAFANVEHIFYEDSLTLAYEITKALGESSLSMCVSIGRAEDSVPDQPEMLVLDPCEIVIRVIENPTLNRGDGGTNITRNRAGEIIARTLKLEQVGDGFLTKARLLNTALPANAPVVGRDIHFTLTATIAADPETEA